LRERSILPRLIISLVSLIAAVSLVLAAALLSVERARRDRDLREAAVVAAEHLARSLAFPAWNVVEREIDSQLEAAMLDPALYGTVFSAPDLDPPVRAWTRDASWKAVGGRPDESLRGLIIESRDIVFEGRAIAELRLVYSDRNERAKLGGEAFAVAAIVIGEAATLSIGLLLILGSSVFRPLRSIERWAAEVSDGGSPRAAEPVAASGEIESLRQSIIRMVGLLDERYETLSTAERELRIALDQKAVFANELFHRTGNNMAVISGLIALREGGRGATIPGRPLRAIKASVDAIALAQKELYKRDDLTYLDLGSYLESITRDIVASDRDRAGSVTVRSMCCELPVMIDVALPVGLSTAELVRNSLEYAFAEGRRGIVSISVRRLAEGGVSARVSDDGPGPGADFDPESSAGLGLELVGALIRGQLRGSVSYDFSGGFACEMRFAEAGPGFTSRL
jgi:two-component sensor histidine kinase